MWWTSTVTHHGFYTHLHLKCSMRRMLILIDVLNKFPLWVCLFSVSSFSLNGWNKQLFPQVSWGVVGSDLDSLQKGELLSMVSVDRLNGRRIQKVHCDVMPAWLTQMQLWQVNSEWIWARYIYSVMVVSPIICPEVGSVWSIRYEWVIFQI